MSRELYNKAFTINAASIYCFKSSRKNSICSDTISINHLINHTEDRKITDERIRQQFTGTLESIVYNALKFNNHLELSVYMDYGKNSSYINANKENYNTWEDIRFSWQRVKFSSIEQCINFLYSVYCLIYPYNEINLQNTIYNDPSVKYYINMYYRKEVAA